LVPVDSAIYTEGITHYLIHSENQPKTFPENARLKLYGYTFPGNTRELKSSIEQSALLANNDKIHNSDLPNGAIHSMDEVEQAYLTKLCSEFTGTPDELTSLLNLSIRKLKGKWQKFDLTLF
jgi:transcriptional regulator of acetoin/glycerol metabolism